MYNDNFLVKENQILREQIKDLKKENGDVKNSLAFIQNHHIKQSSNVDEYNVKIRRRLLKVESIVKKTSLLCKGEPFDRVKFIEKLYKELCDEFSMDY